MNPCSFVFSQKLRCVFDASQWLNKFCVRRKTVLTDLSRIPYLVRQGDFMTVNDLDSGYWQVPIYPPHQTYLGLSFQHKDLSVSYRVWVVMPLGIVDAAHIFTALTDPLMDCIFKKGKRANIYIDICFRPSKGTKRHSCKMSSLKPSLRKEVGFSNPVNPQALFLKESPIWNLSLTLSR